MSDWTTNLDQTWDALVIGTGIGGASIGHALAKQGKHVLFCEKGRSSLAADAKRGDYAEMQFPAPAVPAQRHRRILEQSGRWAEFLEDHSGKRVTRYVPFLGSGTGGSSALYGAAMERFFAEDFAPAASHADRVDADLPEAWPITYAELAPNYARAEVLYGVKGSRDPLRAQEPIEEIPSAPPYGPANRALADLLETKGLHPYRLPTACEFVSGCQTCQGFLCSRDCKNDSVRVCLAPALRDHGARLLDRCRVLRLETQGRHVESVLCERDGQILKLRGRLVILAAGALATPALLLRSESRQWPQGLANGSGMVGRHLMRHCIDLYALAPPIKPTVDENVKELAFNDFYLRDGKKLGTVQSFGRLPPAPMLAASLQEDIRTAAGRTVASLFGLAKPLMRPLLAKTFDNALILASTLEDLPFGDNRVFPVGADGIGINYRLNAKDRARIAAFRSLMADTLQPWKYRLLKQAENNERIAHACGTCRMGTDPANSVVDRDNRAHDLDNLFIVDSAFFPSSGGTNPSLTIAANALRVAERILSGGYLR